MDLVAQHAIAIANVDRHARAVTAQQWSAPTPCSAWDVRALLNHMVYEELWVPPLLGGATLAEIGDRFDGDQLGDDPVGVWSVAAAASQEAIASTPPDTVVNVSWGQISAAEYVGQIVTDMAVHGWDLARGIGADEAIDPGLVAEILPRVERDAEGLTASGQFGTPIDVGPDASPQTRLLAMLGRHG